MPVQNLKYCEYFDVNERYFPYAKGTIRISLGKNNTEEDVERIAAALIKILL